MKQKDMVTLLLSGAIAALLAFIVSGVVFKTGLKNAKIPSAESISQSFPDVRNESNYKIIFNDQALDPTQPIQIQGNNNSAPFLNH